MNIVPTTSQEREDATRIEQVAKKQKEYRLIGKQRKVAGHTLFEFNKTTKEIKPADIHRESVLSVSGKPTYKTRIDVREGCFYPQALNIKIYCDLCNKGYKLEKMYRTLYGIICEDCLNKAEDYERKLEDYERTELKACD